MKKCQLLSYAVVVAITAGFVSDAKSQTISFDEILNNPDDAGLNLEFARQEIASGRLQQAASALERLLLNKPNWDAVRLLYGIVLYRMDDLEGARREFLQLEGRGLSQKHEADRLKYLAKIDHSTSPLRLTGRISVGARYDTNPGLVSDTISSAVIGGNLLFAIPGMNDAEDFGFLGTSRLRLESDIEKAPGSLWFFQIDGNFVDFSDIDRADTISGSIKTGFVLNNDRLKITPYFKASQSWLQGEEFNDRWGGGVNATYRLNPRLKLFANGEFLEEDYHTTTFSVNNNQRDGDVFIGYLGAVIRITEKQSLTIAGFAADKDSNINQGYSYDQLGLSLNSLTLLGQGAYLSITGKYSQVNFKQPDGNATSPFQTVTREDDRFHARAAIGAPLQTISSKYGNGQDLPEFFKDVVMQVGVSWNTLSSTSNLIEYDNISGDVLFTKKFAY